MKIAASMIVKNEENMILDCLRSLERFVDLVVIQDTGSTDDTLKIIKAWAKEQEKIDLILDQEPWKEDFSHHRNACFKLVPVDVDWVLIIDADERLHWYNNGTHRLTKEDGSAFSEAEFQAVAPAFFRKFLEREPVIAQHDCLSALVRDVKKGTTRAVYNNNPRLFRRWSALAKGKKRRPGVRYTSTVHNCPNFRGPMLIVPLLGLDHLGYDPAMVNMEAKHRARIPMMQKRLNATPPDLQMWFFLAEQYGMLGEYDKCLAHAEMYLSLKDKLGREFNQSAYYLAVRTAMSLGQTEKALKWCEDGLQNEPEDLDLLFTLTDLGAMLGRDDLVARGADGYLQTHAKHNAAFKDRIVFTMSDDVRHLCMYRSALSHLRLGVRMFRQWMVEMPQIEPVLRQKMLDDAVGLAKYPELQRLVESLPLGAGLIKEVPQHVAA